MQKHHCQAVGPVIELHGCSVVSALRRMLTATEELCHDVLQLLGQEAQFTSAWQTTPSWRVHSARRLITPPHPSESRIPPAGRFTAAA